MISVTFLSAYLYCSRKLFIEQVLGIKSEIPKEALIKGSIRHKVYENINLAEEGLVKSINQKDFDFVYELYKNKYMRILRQAIISNKNNLKTIGIPLSDFFSQLKPGIENEADYRAGKILKFIDETGLLGEELWENLTPKIKPEYRIFSDKLKIKGIIDELEVHKDFFVPVELKTGKMPSEGVWPGHRIQVGAYALLLEEAFGVPVSKAVIRYLDSKASREIIVNPFLRQEVLELANKVQALLGSGKIPDFSANENKCKSCDLKDVCFDKKAIEEKLELKTKDLNRT